jgi:hypothetical protein
MKLLELSQRAESIGFTIGADSDGLKLKPITVEARAMLKTSSITGIGSMHELIIIVTMLELGV